MLVELLRKVFRAEGPPGAGSSGGLDLATSEPPVQRRSNGLRHFIESLPRRGRLEALDLGGLSESNINFLSRLNGRIHAVDLLEMYDRRRRELPSLRFDADSSREFVDQYLNFPRGHFQALLAWDALEFLDSELLHQVIPRLRDVLRPGGALLTFFHTQSRGETVQTYRYRIDAEDSLLLQSRQLRPLPNTFNNRNLERLFGDFDSVKFFLTRDSLREVIVCR